jgi:hypothetical protein
MPRKTDLSAELAAANGSTFFVRRRYGQEHSWAVMERDAIGHVEIVTIHKRHDSAKRKMKRFVKEIAETSNAPHERRREE